MSKLLAFLRRRVHGLSYGRLLLYASLAAVIVGLYAFKAGAGVEGARIHELDRQIAEEDRQVRLLRAAAARLEQPDRIEKLSEQVLGYGPVSARRETNAAALGEIARQGGQPAPKPVPTQSASLAPAGGPR